MLSLFGNKYKDEEITMCAQNALELESMINSSKMIVQSENGIATLEGSAASEREKFRALDTVMTSLQGSRLKFERVEDQMNVLQAVS